MKLFIGLLSLGIASLSFGATTEIPQVIRVGEITVYNPLRLKAVSGATILFSLPAGNRVHTGVTPNAETAKLCTRQLPESESEFFERQRNVNITLSAMISLIEQREVPRKLEDDEKDTLTRIPLCEPFLEGLRHVSQLLWEAPVAVVTSAGGTRSQSPGLSNVAVIFYNRDYKRSAHNYGRLDVRVGNEVATFKLEYPIEIDPTTGTPMNLARNLGQSNAAGQKMNIHIQDITPLTEGCLKVYALSLQDRLGREKVEMKFAVKDPTSLSCHQ